jgi:hypothetical protein
LKREILLQKDELKKTLEYQNPYGMPSFISLLRHLNRAIHHPPEATEANSEVMVSTGSQDALCKCAEMMLNVGDPIIAEKYAYTGTMLAILPYRPDFIAIEADGDGMRADKFREALQKRKQENKSVIKFKSVVYRFFLRNTSEMSANNIDPSLSNCFVINLKKKLDTFLPFTPQHAILLLPTNSFFQSSFTFRCPNFCTSTQQALTPLEPC